MILKKSTFGIIFLAFSIVAVAQDRCATMKYEDLKHGAGSYRAREAIFERWLKNKIAVTGFTRSFGTQQGQVYTIPVVVHVVHNGEPEGTGVNIPDEQILSQIATLNEDFRRMNADTVNTDPMFLPVAADVQIEFELAQRDPEGLPTNGIVRVEGPLAGYTLATDRILKSQSFWPSEDYMNVWVTTLPGLAGYAQFPFSNISGLANEVNNDRTTDGIVINYLFFGTGFNADEDSKGRTATHEVGHFLGLRHTWGDGGCGVDDFCEDTPRMSGSTQAFTCPDPRELSCGNVPMIENYMDFTLDSCMNIFTECQRTRMRTVMENSPRRLSLISSPGSTPPVSVTNDVGIRSITSPDISLCADSFIPQVEVRNYGTNEVTSFSIDVVLNGVVRESITNTTTLSPQELTAVIFSPLAVSEGALEEISFHITETNGTTDNNSENDVKSMVVQVPEIADLPLSEDFEDFVDTGWVTLNNNDREPLWELINAPLNTANNTALYLNFVESESVRFGDFDYLLSPVFDFSKIESAELNFNYAYAFVNGNRTDGLTVGISTDCGQTYRMADFVFEKLAGPCTPGDDTCPNLETSTSNGLPFVPAGPDDWAEVNINLTPYIGESEVQIAFIGQNGLGNTLYLDNILVEANSLFNFDIRVTGIQDLPLISCDSIQSPQVFFKNFGSSPVIEVTYEYSVNGGTPIPGVYTGLVPSGEEDFIQIPTLFLDQGPGIFEFTALQINGVDDQDPSDNNIAQNFNIDDREETIPLRQNFEVTSIDSLDWFVFSETGPSDWEIATVVRGADSTQTTQTLSVQAFNSTSFGSRNWLVTPTLDLREFEEASMFFDVSYGWNMSADDQLEVFVSTNCGEDFNQVVYDKSGETLSVATSADEWIPSEEVDWRREFIDLSSFTGFGRVMVAFVFSNRNGNNFYIDNIEFFTSSDSDPVMVEDDLIAIYPNPATFEFNLTFNLEEREDVVMTLVDATGRQSFQYELPNTLNQTYRVQTLNERSGVYFLNVIGNTVEFTKRVLILSPGEDYFR